MDITGLLLISFTLDVKIEPLMHAKISLPASNTASHFNLPIVSLSSRRVYINVSSSLQLYCMRSILTRFYASRLCISYLYKERCQNKAPLRSVTT